MHVVDHLIPAEFRSEVRGPLRRIYAATIINCFGNGMAFSVFVVYLHNIRGFSVTFATLLLGISAIVGLCISPLWGTLIDHVGPGVVGPVSFLMSAVGLALWTGVHTKVAAIVVALIITVSEGAGWGPGMVMMTRLVSEEHRQRAYGVNFMMVNLGIGAGLLVSASIASIQHPASFTVLYLFDAAVTLVAGLIFFTLIPHGKPVHQALEEGEVREGWRTVLGDRRLFLYVGASIVLILGGYGSVDAGLSLFVVNNLHLSIHIIGITFFFNTVTIVFGQLWVLNKMQGKSRTKAMALVGVLWFVFWAVLGGSLAVPAVVAVVALCATQILFAIGETMLQPAGSAIVNEIAPEHLRGRYNSAAGAAWGISGTVAPAIAGIYYALHVGNWWPIGTGILALIGSVLMLLLRKQLTPEQDGVGVGAPA
jgi:MFS family permease